MADGDAYNDGKVYLVTGATLNALKSADAKNLLNVVQGSGLEITERSEYAGTVLDAPNGTGEGGGGGPTIPDPPTDGVYVLGTDGAGGIVWIATESCGET